MLCKFSKCREQDEQWECSVTSKQMQHPCDDTLGTPDVHCYSPLDANPLPPPQAGWICTPCMRCRDERGGKDVHSLSAWCGGCNPPKEVQ